MKKKNEKSHYKIADKRENALTNRIKFVQHSNEIEINNENFFVFDSFRRYYVKITCDFR